APTMAQILRSAQDFGSRLPPQTSVTQVFSDFGKDSGYNRPSPRTLDTMRTRIPLLYLILAVLLVISVVPVWLFGTKVVSISRDKLKTNEMLLQNTITRSLSEDVAQRISNLRLM